MYVAFAARENNVIHGFDGAFINSMFPSDTPAIYIRQPSGYNRRPGFVLRLKRPLFSFSPKFWNLEFTNTCVKTLKYEKFTSDPCLFRRWHEPTQCYVYLSIYADDCMVQGPSQEITEMMMQEIFDR